jgi:hypothetical protein
MPLRERFAELDFKGEFTTNLLDKCVAISERHTIAALVAQKAELQMHEVEACDNAFDNGFSVGKEEGGRGLTAHREERDEQI